MKPMNAILISGLLLLNSVSFADEGPGRIYYSSDATLGALNSMNRGQFDSWRAEGEMVAIRGHQQRESDAAEQAEELRRSLRIIKNIETSLDNIFRKLVEHEPLLKDILLVGSEIGVVKYVDVNGVLKPQLDGLRYAYLQKKYGFPLEVESDSTRERLVWKGLQAIKERYSHFPEVRSGLDFNTVSSLFDHLGRLTAQYRNEHVHRTFFYLQMRDTKTLLAAIESVYILSNTVESREFKNIKALIAQVRSLPENSPQQMHLMDQLIKVIPKGDYQANAFHVFRQILRHNGIEDGLKTEAQTKAIQKDFRSIIPATEIDYNRLKYHSSDAEDRMEEYLKKPRAIRCSKVML